MMDGWSGWMDGWMEWLSDGGLDDGWMDEKVVGWVKRWLDGGIEGWRS